MAEVRDGDRLRYPHDLIRGVDAAEATALLRQVLAEQPDGSVVIAQVGFSTDLARLLESPADTASPLDGKSLVARKVRLLSAMAGAFEPIDGARHLEYNVVKDVPAAQKLAKQWPTPVFWSGFEIGRPEIEYTHAEANADADDLVTLAAEQRLARGVTVGARFRELGKRTSWTARELDLECFRQWHHESGPGVWHRLRPQHWF